MNVIFTCGGTAGHVNPALALARYMQEKDSTVKVLFIGTPDGIERDLVEKAGYDFEGVEVSNFHRDLSPKGIRHNLRTVKLLGASERKAKDILRRFKADLVVGTGGYASFPAVKAASKLGIPTAVHESNMIPGLTTKMLEKRVKCVMVGFEDCRRHYKHPEKIVVTGTPVRGDFFALTRAEARAAVDMHVDEAGGEDLGDQVSRFARLRGGDGGDHAVLDGYDLVSDKALGRKKPFRVNAHGITPW